MIHGNIRTPFPRHCPTRLPSSGPMWFPLPFAWPFPEYISRAHQGKRQKTVLPPSHPCLFTRRCHEGRCAEERWESSRLLNLSTFILLLLLPSLPLFLFSSPLASSRHVSVESSRSLNSHSDTPVTLPNSTFVQQSSVDPPALRLAFLEDTSYM